MHGAGNDFIVVNALRQPVNLQAAQWRALADRHFGIGADQILIVGAPQQPEHDFSYRIINADGAEVEHCGNGARAFMRYVVDFGLTQKRRVLVEIQRGVIELHMNEAGEITVAMGIPEWETARVPFDTTELTPKTEGSLALWPLTLDDRTLSIGVVSMGNPHAVQTVPNVDAARVCEDGARIEHHPRFPQRVNAGFMQVLNRHAIRLRVWERGTGETLACGTGACAAVVTGIERGWLASPVQVQTRGGILTIAWAGRGEQVLLTGPATRVFDGEIDVEALPSIPSVA